MGVMLKKILPREAVDSVLIRGFTGQLRIDNLELWNINTYPKYIDAKPQSVYKCAPTFEFLSSTYFTIFNDSADNEIKA